jgi:HlyD family secretion protein
MAAADEKRNVSAPERPKAPAFEPLAAGASELAATAPSLVTRGVLYALVLLLVTAILWATFSQIDRVVVATGRLITRSQPIVVQPLETSVVRSVDVRVGQAVSKGERLVTLDPTFAEADITQVKQRFASLEAEVTRLEAELAGKPYRSDGDKDSAVQAEIYDKRNGEYVARINSYKADLARIDADLTGTQRTVAVLEERLASVKAIEKMKAELKEKQFVSQMGLLEAREKRLEVETAFEDASNRLKQLREQATKARADMDVFTKAWRQKTLDDTVRARRERDALREQLSKMERRGALVYLTAPFDATVLEINKRTVGSVAKEADTILTLVPQDDVLEAEVQISAEDVGFIRKNDPARLKIDAFPFQRHGTVDGTLTVIGADSIAVEAAGGQRVYFPARVTNITGKLRAVPEDTRLSPGMTVTAEIRVGTRSAISYFLWPLIKAFDESMREP